MSDLAEALDGAVRKVSADWKKAKRQADQEDRVSKARLSRMRRRPLPKTTIRDAAFAAIEQAYQRASGNGRYLANARQVMYAARPHVLELTGGEIWSTSAYFTQTLLKDYIEEYDPPWASRIVWDARGHLTEPHTGRDIRIGGAEVAQYRRDWTNGDIEKCPTVALPVDITTVGPQHRFGAALFIEKEGFDFILGDAGLADRYDLAIMSTKGVPVGAACDLVNFFNHAGVRVFVLRDFDLGGFKIIRTLRTGTRLHPGGEVTDLGLRMADIADLQQEPVEYKQRSDPRRYLSRCGATEDECAFLVHTRTGRGWYGARVELNAMTSDQLLSWLEGKLQEHGVRKVVPDADVLANAYRRAALLVEMERALDAALKKLDADVVTVPPDLAARVTEMIAGKPHAWDAAVMALARRAQAGDAD